MRFDYRRRASYISGKSFVVGMAIWGVLFAGLILIDLATLPATESDPVMVSIYGYDLYVVEQDSED